MTDRDRLRALWVRWSLAIAAAMVVGGFFAGMFVAARYEARLGRIARETSAVRERLRAEEAAPAERAAVAESLVELLRDPTTRVIELSGQGSNSRARGRVVWQDGAGGYVFVSNLRPPPARQTYLLWAISGGRPRPAGALEVDAGGQATRRLAAVGVAVDAFTVTLEPSAGAQTPTGPTALSSR